MADPADIFRYVGAYWQSRKASWEPSAAGFLQSVFLGKPTWGYLGDGDPSWRIRFGGGKKDSEAETVAEEEALPFEPFASCEDRIAYLRDLARGGEGSWCEEEGSAAGAVRSRIAFVAAAARREGRAGLLAAAHSAVVSGLGIRREERLRWKDDFPSWDSWEKPLAYAVTEQESGSDLSLLKTAIRKEGERFLLTGRKVAVVNSTLADAFLVGALGYGEGEETERLSLFLVPAARRGIAVLEDRHPPLDGIGMGTIEFRGVEVTEKDLVGRPGEGYAVLLGVLSVLRLGIAAVVGEVVSRRAREAKNYARKRRLFGKSLLDQEIVAERVRGWEDRLAVLGAMLGVTSELAAAERDIGAEAAVTALFACEEAGRVFEEAVELMGRTGVPAAAGPDEGLLLAAARIMTGGRDVLRFFAGLYAGLPLARFLVKTSKRFGERGMFAAMMKRLRHDLRLRMARPRPPFGREVPQVAALAGETLGVLGERADLVFRHYGPCVQEHGYELRRLADLALEGFALVTLMATLPEGDESSGRRSGEAEDAEGGAGGAGERDGEGEAERERVERWARRVQRLAPVLSSEFFFEA
ncbi:MAG: acyl-CoA dehydrogenase [Candidatus Hydrogenedentota bacterium]|nr:MAG: acyl-CoA dehydrogenase [Candidatus Hydrogenedentota bacterium]